MKHLLRKKALELRTRGFTYAEILEQIPVAKSTLSLWLRDVGLSKRQKQRVTEKRLSAALRGGKIRREQRISLTEAIYRNAKKDIGKISKRELWLIGVMLYWAEGSKEKEGRPGIGVQFTNSDSRMIRLFLRWLLSVCNIQRDKIYFDIFIHENNKYRIEDVINHWSDTTGFSRNSFLHIYFKKNKVKTNRTNTGNLYFGVLKIKVRASSILNRKIAAWTEGVVEYFR